MELPWAVDPGRQGHGLATEAALAAIVWARSLRLEVVVAMMTPGNAPSRRVAEKAGLQLSGKTQRAGLDHLLYRLRLEDADS